MLLRIGVVIGIFLIFVVVGFFKQRSDLSKISTNRNFLVEYRNKFIEYIIRDDREANRYLNLNLNKAQRVMGLSEIFEKFRFPFENGYHRNVAALSLLSQIEGFKNSGVLDSEVRDFAQILESTFLHSIGDCEEMVSSIKDGIFNPFKNFYIGFNYMFKLPFVALSIMFTGKDSFSTNKLLRTLIKVATVLLQLLFVLSALITIFIGWDEFTEMLRKL